MFRKSVYQIVLFMALCLLPTNMFAKNIGYVWIATTGWFDAINYADREMKFVFNGVNGLPEINSQVTLENGNRIYRSHNIIEKIDRKFTSLLGTRKCNSLKGSATSFMLNLSEYASCSVDTYLYDIVKPEFSYLSPSRIDASRAYFYYADKKRVKVLGFVQFSKLSFMMIEW